VAGAVDWHTVITNGYQAMTCHKHGYAWPLSVSATSASLMASGRPRRLSLLLI